jgi:hypothetical protein
MYSKKKKVVSGATARRGTNASADSNETAKKVLVDPSS